MSSETDEGKNDGKQQRKETRRGRRRQGVWRGTDGRCGLKEWVVKQVKRSRKGKAGEDGEQHRAVVLLADEEREEEEAVGGVEGKREGGREFSVGPLPHRCSSYQQTE